MKILIKPQLNNLLGFIFLISILLIRIAWTEESFPNNDFQTTTYSQTLKTFHKNKKKTFILPPLTSFLLPGFDQWWEEDRITASIYSGIAIGGIAYSNNLKPFDLRHHSLGIQIYWASGASSMYESFRDAVDSRSEDFPFLKHRETPKDLLLAPFQVSYITQMTTFLPLLMAFGLAFIEPYQFNRPGLEASQLTPKEFYFDSTQSYLAGTWEEQAFRGYIMPVAMYYTRNAFTSNLLTSLFFSAGHAHYAQNFIPWYQFVMSMYLGHLCQKNEWMLGESIFIHAWWDFILFLGSSMTHRSRGLEIRLPALQIRF